MASIVRVSILGTLPGGEVWSVNPCFFLQDEPASVSSAEALAIANALKALVIPTGVRQIMNASTAITGYRVEARDRDGVLEAQAESTLAAPSVGTGTQNHPGQTSLVCSLRSGFPGGRGRGRLYFPATGMAITAATLRADATQLASALSAFKTYLTAIEGAVAVSAGPADLAVWSRAGTDFHMVIALRVGDVLDVQRRRRDTLAEGYSEAVYP